MAVAAFLFTSSAFAGEPKEKEKKIEKAKTEKSCSTEEKKSCGTEKKGGCCSSKKAEEKKA